jgi:hypothetical protein
MTAYSLDVVTGIFPSARREQCLKLLQLVSCAQVIGAFCCWETVENQRRKGNRQDSCLIPKITSAEICLGLTKDRLGFLIHALPSGKPIS